MNETKNVRLREQKKVITLILLISAALFFILSFIVKDKDLKMILLIVGAALISALFIARLFKGSLGNKPTLEEIEERQFGKME